METNTATLSYDEVATAKSAIRVIRMVTLALTAVAVPVVCAVCTPVIALVLLGAVVAAPAIFVFVVTAAIRQDRFERQVAGS